MAAFVCSILGLGDILAVPDIEPREAQQLRASFFGVQCTEIPPDMTYFSVASMKPELGIPMVVDPKKTRVVLQVKS